jgi:hypothetical protein
VFKKFHLFLTVLSVFTLVFCLTTANAAGPKGAKAIFDSGEGPSVGMSVSRSPMPTAAEPVRKEKYSGISYQLLLLSEDGQFRAVPKSRTFRSGERVKMLVRTNRPGYMTIFNLGSSGRTNLLFNEYVDAFTMHEIPRNTNFLFTGEPGAEKLLVMLSDAPNPMATEPAVTASAPPQNQPPAYTPEPPSSPTASSSSSPGYTPPPPATAVTNLPPPPVAAMVASIDGAKSVKGAKDIVVEDKMQNSYTVISPKNGWKPVKGGMKDIVVESSAGSNYGVIPASAVADGGILTLEIKLKHR